MIIPAVPLIMAWIGSIGGLLGVISFSDTYIGKLVNAFKGPIMAQQASNHSYGDVLGGYIANLIDLLGSNHVYV